MITLLKKNIFVFVSLFLFSSPFSVSAARLYFTHEQANSDEIKVILHVDSDQSVNAFDVKLTVPEDAEVIDIHDGNSVIKFWSDMPTFDELSNSIFFSGIVPGGFVGEDATLISFNLKTKKVGIVDVHRDSRVYENTPDGTLDVYTKESLTINPHNVPSISDHVDVEIPEHFVPVVTSDPLLYDGKQVLIFKTEDKQSGISYYEVQESRSRKADPDEWIKTQSPYVLADQDLKSYIHIQAVDNEGNIRVERISPKNGLLSYALYLLCGILIILFMSYIVSKKRKK